MIEVHNSTGKSVKETETDRLNEAKTKALPLTVFLEKPSKKGLTLVPLINISIKH